MLRVSESKQQPQIQRLQNSILIPCNVVQKTMTDEEGNTENIYKYDELLIVDRGQDINDSAFKQNYYKELRKEYILGKMSQHEQNEAIVEYHAGDSTKLDTLVALKTETATLFPKA